MLTAVRRTRRPSRRHTIRARARSNYTRAVHARKAAITRRADRHVVGRARRVARGRRLPVAARARVRDALVHADQAEVQRDAIPGMEKDRISPRLTGPIV